MPSLWNSFKNTFSTNASFDVTKVNPLRQCPGCEKYSRNDPKMCKWCTNLKWLLESQKDYILHDIKEDSDELEKSLLEIWSNTVESCRLGGNHFVDDKFSMNTKSVWYNQENVQDLQWARLFNETNASEWTVFNCPSALNIVKRNAKKSWFLDALCCVAERPELLQSIILTKELCLEGVYVLRLCKDGRWTHVVIDDCFPCDVNGGPLHALASNNQLWVPLIEKAAAKMCGCYEALTTDGNVCEGLSMLTGAPTESLLLESEDANDLWKRLMDSFSNKFLMVATSKEKKYNIMPNQNYSVLHVFEYEGERLIELRCSIAKETTTGSEFQFNVKYEHFLKSFSMLHICRVRDNWSVVRFEGTFPNTGFGGEDIPIRRLNITTKTEIDFTIFQDSQKEKPLSERLLYDFSVVIFSEGTGHEVTSRVNFRDVIKYSPRVTESSVSLTCVLEPGPYLITFISINPIISDFDLTKYMYVVAVHSRSPLLPMRKLSVTKCGIGDALIRLSLVKGAIAVDLQTVVPAGVMVYVLEKNWHGIIVMIENTIKNKFLEVDFDYGKSVNMFNTRERSYTKDAIPPTYRRIVAILSSKDCGQFTKPSINRTITGRLVDTRSPSDEMSVPRFGERTAGLHFPRPVWLT